MSDNFFNDPYTDFKKSYSIGILMHEVGHNIYNSRNSLEKIFLAAIYNPIFYPIQTFAVLSTNYNSNLNQMSAGFVYGSTYYSLSNASSVVSREIKSTTKEIRWFTELCPKNPSMCFAETDNLFRIPRTLIKQVIFIVRYQIDFFVLQFSNIFGGLFYVFSTLFYIIIYKGNVIYDTKLLFYYPLLYLGIILAIIFWGKFLDLIYRIIKKIIRR